MKKYNKADIMKRAHEIRKASNPRITMGDALRASWKIAKEENNMSKREMSFAWTTQKGAKIEMTVTVEHVTRETIDSDGWKCEVNCDKWFRECTAMTINGKPQAMHKLSYFGNKDTVVIGYQGRNPMGATLPADVVEAIYGEERRARAAKLERELAAAARYEAHYKKVVKAMSM